MVVLWGLLIIKLSFVEYKGCEVFNGNLVYLLHEYLDFYLEFFEAI